MTEERLANYQILKKELNQLNNQLLEIKETFIGASKINVMPNSNSISNPTEQLAERIINVEKRIIAKQIDLISEIELIEDFLNNISDKEISLIIRKRYIEGLKWEQIGFDLNADRTTVYKKIKNHFRKASDTNEKNKRI